MQSLACFWIISLSLLFGSAFALPYGCGGELGTLKVTEGGYKGLIWTCSGVDPKYPSLYHSGQNYLWARAETHNVSDCANYCSGWFYDGMNAGVYYSNSTCECWAYGNPNTSPSAATATSGSATYLDFYETSSIFRPNTAQHWGKFTCPEGAYYNTVYQQGIPYRACYPLNIEPGQAALKDCPSSGTQWETWTSVNGFKVATCYAKLSAAKISLNFSSPYALVDVYDFTSHTSTSKKAISTSTSKKTTSTSTSKKTTSTSTRHTSASTRKSTSTPKTTNSAKTTNTATVHTTKKNWKNPGALHHTSIWL